MPSRAIYSLRTRDDIFFATRGSHHDNDSLRQSPASSRNKVLSRRRCSNRLWRFVMTSFSSRAYAGSADLDRQIDFAQTATGARWPRSSYMKAGDVVWMMFTPGFEPETNIRLWFDNIGLAAYACFEPPLTVDFDIRPGASPDDSLADEVLQWAEKRRRDLGDLGKETIPKAYAMLGENTISTKALDSDRKRVSLLERNGYRRTD